MQSFVPSVKSFTACAKLLDNRRLNKNALEGWQILMTLLELDPHGNHRVPKGWVNHPAVRMWRGHEGALTSYIVSMVMEWEKRGYKSTIALKALTTYAQAKQLGRITSDSHKLPAWMQDKKLFDQIASSHRMALLNKDYEWYSQFGWSEDTGSRPDTYDYIWPV